jgi:hypothetical protein
LRRRNVDRALALIARHDIRCHLLVCTVYTRILGSGAGRELRACLRSDQSVDQHTIELECSSVGGWL